MNRKIISLVAGSSIVLALLLASCGPAAVEKEKAIQPEEEVIQPEEEEMAKAEETDKVKEAEMARPASHEVADKQTLQKWALKLIEFGEGNPVFPGIRQAGTEADDRATQWLEDMFKSFGLEDVHREPVPITGWQPSEYRLTVHTANGDVPFDAWPIFYAKFFDTGSVTAEMVYVGSSPIGDMAGKIVVADMISPMAIGYDGLKAVSLETYDPDNTLQPGERHRYWTFTNQDVYERAAAGGAVAFIGINVDKADDGRYFQNAGGVKADPLGEWWPTLGRLPGLYVSRATGEKLRPLAQAGASATVVSAGTNPRTQTYNVVGILPGQSEKVIQVQSHSDGGAVNDAAGVTGVLALAEYYSKAKLSDRKKTLQFVITAGHFISGVGMRTFIKEHTATLKQNVLVNLTIEHHGKHYDLVDGKLIDSGLPCPLCLYTSNNDWLSLLSDAVHRYDLRRTFILPYSGPGAGEGAHWHWATSLPSIFIVTPVQYMQSTVDTEEKLDLERTRSVIAAFAYIIDRLDDTLE